MTQSFDDFYWKQFDIKNKDTSLAERFGRDVWDHKQAEIDELRKQLDLINQYTDAQGEAVKVANDERLELWKRIDEVLDYIGSDFDDYYTGVLVESIHEILKGNNQ